MAAMVLIVDDDPDILELISALLTEEGFDTVTCSDGLAALAAINTQCPAVAIIDLAMPVMTGTELIERLRQAPGQPLPIIALSSSVFEPPQDHLQQTLHVDAFLSKPFDLEELLAHVQHLAQPQSEPMLLDSEEQPTLLPVRHSAPGPH